MGVLSSVDSSMFYKTCKEASAPLQLIAQFLANYGWEYRVEVANDRILAYVKAENVDDGLQVILQLIQNGKSKSLKVYTSPLLQVQNHVYKCVILQTLLDLHKEFWLLRFESTQTEGEFVINFPPLSTEQTTLHQLKWCLDDLSYLINTAMPRLKQVLATGSDPGRGCE